MYNKFSSIDYKIDSMECPQPQDHDFCRLIDVFSAHLNHLSDPVAEKNPIPPIHISYLGMADTS